MTRLPTDAEHVFLSRIAAAEPDGYPYRTVDEQEWAIRLSSHERWIVDRWVDVAPDTEDGHYQWRGHLTPAGLAALSAPRPGALTREEPPMPFAEHSSPPGDRDPDEEDHFNEELPPLPSSREIAAEIAPTIRQSGVTVTEEPFLPPADSPTGFTSPCDFEGCGAPAILVTARRRRCHVHAHMRRPRSDRGMKRGPRGVAAAAPASSTPPEPPTPPAAPEEVAVISPRLGSAAWRAPPPPAPPETPPPPTAYAVTGNRLGSAAWSESVVAAAAAGQAAPPQSPDTAAYQAALETIEREDVADAAVGFNVRQWALDTASLLVQRLDRLIALLNEEVP